MRSDLPESSSYAAGEELVDLLDAHGTPTGMTKRKRDAHRDGDWHRSVHVWIATTDGQVLIQRRSREKENYPGLWDVSAAGHVTAGENAAEAAVRETREELGIEIAANDLRRIGSLVEQHVLNGGTYIDNEHHEIYLVVCNVELAALRLQEAEVDEVTLVSIDSLPIDAMVPHEAEYTLLRRAVRSVPPAGQ